MALIASVLLIVAGALPVLFLAGLVAWQVVTLFQAGAWVPLPVLLLFTDHAVLQAGKLAPVLGFIPDLSLIWTAGTDTVKPVLWVLSRLHFAVLPALAGLALIALGVRGLLRQRAALHARKNYQEDRLRRVQDYRQDDADSDAFDGRREPFISGLTGLVGEKNPAQRGARAG
jgi:hypothetical protein